MRLRLLCLLLALVGCAQAFVAPVGASMTVAAARGCLAPAIEMTSIAKKAKAHCRKLKIRKTVAKRFKVTARVDGSARPATFVAFRERVAGSCPELSALRALRLRPMRCCSTFPPSRVGAGDGHGQAAAPLCEQGAHPDEEEPVAQDEPAADRPARVGQADADDAEDPAGKRICICINKR